MHLRVGPVLHWVRGERCGNLQPEGLRLGFGGVPEGIGGDYHSGKSPPFKIVDVVHTARRTRSSISECFNYSVALAGYLVAEVHRRRLSERRFDIPQDYGASPAEVFLQTVQKDVATGLADVEQAYREPLQRCPACDERAAGRFNLRRRVKKQRSPW